MFRLSAFCFLCLFGSLSADVDHVPHPIDVAFEGKLSFMGSNAEMVQNITAAREAWHAEIDKQMALLLPLLTDTQQVLIKDAQTKWDAAHEADIAFYNADRKQIRSMVGREGEIGMSLELMQAVRARALKLTDWGMLYRRDVTSFNSK